MTDISLLKDEDFGRIDDLVAYYEETKTQKKLGIFRDQVNAAFEGSETLDQLIHFRKGRIKDPQHLRKKLQRKFNCARNGGQPCDVSRENFFTEINDLVGLRLIHLYTAQFPEIDAELRSIFAEHKYDLVEGPFARTWDSEYRRFFRDHNVETQESRSMYTSVHYIIGSNSATKLTCELQVRTLMEEVWGEVDHSMNYPAPHPSPVIREQLLTLARSTSATTRLVDCIFKCKTHLEPE